MGASHKKNSRIPDAAVKSTDFLLFFLISALWANAIDERDSAQRAAIDRFPDLIFLRGGIDTAGEGDFGDVQFVFQKIINDLDHAFHGHGFFGNNETTIRIGGGQFGLEGFPLYRVGACTVFDSLLFIDLKNSGKNGVVFAQDEGMVEILQHAPGRFLNLVAGKNHVDARIDGILDLNGQDAGVAMKILCFALKTVEPMGILEIKRRDTSHFTILSLGYFVRKAIALRFDFKTGLRMPAGLTNFRRFFADMALPAVAAYPAVFAVFSPDFAIFSKQAAICSKPSSPARFAK